MRGQDEIVGTNVPGVLVDAELRQRHQPSVPHAINVDVRDSDGQTPLHVASRNAHVEAARMIIRQGTDINARDNYDCTPLQEASSHGHLDVARLLLEHGAAVQVQNNRGWTPLHEASGNG